MAHFHRPHYHRPTSFHHHHHHSPPRMHSHFPTGGGGGDGNPLIALIAIPIMAFIFFVFILPQIQQHNQEWGKGDFGQPEMGFAPDPDQQRWQAEQEERQRREAERAQLQGEFDKLTHEVRDLREQGDYQAALLLAKGLQARFGGEANRLNMHSEFNALQRVAVNACFALACDKAAAMVKDDRYRAAIDVIEKLDGDINDQARAAGLQKELHDIQEGYRFVLDLAETAGKLKPQQ